MIARFLYAPSKPFAGRDNPAALIVRIAEPAQCPRNFQMRLRLEREAMRLLVRLHAGIEPAEREAEIAAQRMNAGARTEIRGLAERALGVIERFERFLVPIHDAQGRGNTHPGMAVTGLVDREVERFAISRERIVRPSELQQQLAQQDAALVQENWLARERACFVDETQRALESQCRLLGQRRVEISRCGAVILCCSEVIGAQGRVAVRIPLGSDAMQFAAL
ncbi:MAG TPA: hypothetical protein VJR89_23805 [Polyangiales bacterium]|nr:hypothetical protein [Polyangiales bacterium]